MKTIRRLALVLALSLGAAACSTSITGPDWDNDAEAPHVPGGNNHTPGGNN